uniref:Rho GTPase activating protein 27 n=1 Tax=Neogobius melanostomus TaxID=47308 RepID=A0A8C6WRH7_9GOBI
QIQHSHKSRVTNSLNSLCFYFYNLIPQSLPSLGHGGSASSLHAALQDQKLSDWDFHHDTSGRPFYMNRVTLERSWKPPRGREQGAEPGGVRVELGREGAKPGTSFNLTLSLAARFCALVSWTVCGHADGSRSEWELPKLNLSPPHLTAEGAKTRSLDRRTAEPIVLTKWRHSTHILEPQEKPSEKCGVLNMTKITEHGKKVRKNWTSSWTVLQGSTLLFTKGQTGGSSWFGGQSKPELTVDLRGAAVDWAPKDRSSKKHVVELKTRQGTELLIQSDHEALVQDWLQALQESISTHAWESDEGLEDDLPESPGRDDKNDRNQHRVVKNSSSLDVSEDKKTRHRLKRFLTRRPTLQAVRDKGYIKDQVFGCSLSALCQRENSTVPRFVKMCIEHVENDGLSIDGLYRVSGNLAVIQKLRFAVNHDERVNLSDSKWEDIHVTTGALKMFFRDLPEPLFPYGLFHDFVSAIKSPDFRQRVQSIKDLVRQLPEENHDTMQALFRHLRRVVDHGDHNRMTIQSVAIVFGPTLLRPEIETWNMAVHMVYQNQIVELILLECESIFER